MVARPRRPPRAGNGNRQNHPAEDPMAPERDGHDVQAGHAAEPVPEHADRALDAPWQPVQTVPQFHGHLRTCLPRGPRNGTSVAENTPFVNLLFMKKDQ